MTVSEVQRVARSLNIAAKSPAYVLKSADIAAIRSKFQEQQAVRSSGDEGGAAAAGTEPEGVREEQDALAEAEARALRELPRAMVRALPAGVRDEGQVELRLHEEFYTWLETPGTEPRLKRRANLVLRQFLTRGRPTNVKSVAGPGNGWLRTRLGGNGGNQFYLWWAKAGATPVAGLPLAGKQVLLRTVRHHDDTSNALDPGRPEDWVPLRATELSEQRDTYGYAWSEEQDRIAAEPAPIRLIKGHPGTGKTTTLWLASAYAEGSRAIYITYSKRLAAETEQYFRAFGPKGLAIDVLTFEDLLGEFAPASSGMGDGARTTRLLPPEEAVRAMRTRLAGYRERWVPWEDHPAELYAELHAHFVGRALPVPFRGQPAFAGPVLGAAAYVAARREVIGEQAARSAGAVGDYLWQAKALARLTPGPLLARAALDGLRMGTALPERLRGLDWIFVDEVQDLTLVEALLLVELAVRIGRERGCLPGLLAAGDEGQTVRPTDFEWGPLADLLHERLGARAEYELAGNLRSPRNIAEVINRSWDFYRRLDKSERPRGHAEAEVEETAVGRIIYCRARGDEQLDTLMQAFAHTPGAALIHPGHVVPPELAQRGVEVWSSDSAKGLDFQVVGVIDAGRTLLRLERQAQAANESIDGRLTALWARTLADQLRVALSRSTDTLVLIDRDAPEADAQDDGARAAELVFELCKDLEGFMEEMEPAELAKLLDREDADAGALVIDYVASIDKLLQDHPMRALQQARNASGLLGGVKTPGAVTDPTLRKDVWRLRGLAALLAATSDEAHDAALFKEANTWLRKAELADAAKAALQLRNLYASLRSDGKPAHEEALLLAQSLPALQDTVPEVEAVLRRGVVDWCRGVTRAELPPTPSGRKKLEEAVTKLAHQLGPRHPELNGHRERVRARVARALLDDGHPRDALDYFGMLERPDPRGEAECHERLGELTRAADCYERAGDLPAALRCARAVPDFKLALRLARAADPAVVAALEWAERLRVEAAAAEPLQRAPLTDAEREHLLAALNRSLGGTDGPSREPRKRKPRGR